MSRNRAARRRDHKLDVMEAFDGYAPLRNGLRRIATEQKHWAGIPIPVTDMPLTIEPSYPNAKMLMEINAKDPEPADDTTGVVKLNCFWSKTRRADVYIWNEPDGRLQWGTEPGYNRLGMAIQTLGASVAWGVEQEAKAVQTLAGLLSHHRFKQYMLTGMFLETSVRSGVMYLFRRLRPTIAIRLEENRTPRILCALCLHPIGYYSGTWAGAMAPSDDVIAHLMLMRGDEAMFWRRANQIAPHRPEAGI
jgi:hypothetical protein